MKTEEKQKLRAVIEHEILPGVTEDVLIYGEIDRFGGISWNDPQHILDGYCKFVHIYVIDGHKNSNCIDGT